MATSEVIYTGDLRTSARHLQSGTVIGTDAPKDNQGKGELFSPTDLVATALASCMLTIMGITARREGHRIDMDGTKATVTKVMASNPRRISEIVVEIEFPHTYSEKEMKILEHAAHTCPVALSLNPEIKQDIRFRYGKS